MSESSETIETITLTGKDKVELDKKQWDWQTGGAAVVILEVYADERLPLWMNRPRRYSKIEAVGRVSRRIDYYRRQPSG